MEQDDSNITVYAVVRRATGELCVDLQEDLALSSDDQYELSKDYEWRKFKLVPDV